MINLLKKNIPSFLSFTTATSDTATATASVSMGDYKLQPHQPILGLGLINATRVTNRTLNVLESATLKPNNNNTSSPTSPSKRIEFIDNIHGEVDGLMGCTESLGFESSNERRVNDELIDQMVQIHSKNNVDNDNDNDHDHDDDNKEEEEDEEEGEEEEEDVDDDDDDDDDDHVWRRRMMMSAEGRGNWKSKVRSFPPPLSWLNRDGKPSFILRPVRKDGRLELTEVRIQRPEILHASRHDGRLTLHLIPDHSIEEEEELEQLLDEEIRLEQEEEEEEELDELLDEELMEEEEGEVVEGIRYEEEEEEERVDMGCNEGLRRCYQMMNQHHNHHVNGNNHHHHHMRMCGINISVPC